MDNEALLSNKLKSYTQGEFNSVYHYVTTSESGLCQKIKKNAHCSPGGMLFSLVPVLKWLPRYNWRGHFLPDVVSGFTVAIMHIPQGMAYSSLGGVPPITGIYMAFFPVLIYFLFGTSRHISMGTFAVVCIMASKPVLLYSNTHIDHSALNSTASHNISQLPTYSPVQVAAVVCFAVGVWQVLLGLCRLGSLSVLMSETLISGFTTGAAVLVCCSQIKHVFGIKLPKHTGPLQLLRTILSLINMIEQTNYMAILITAVVIVVLLIYSELIKPKLRCKCNVPIPIELVLVVVGTLMSRYFYLQETFHISVVGDIPTGLPEPLLPPMTLLPNVLVDGLVIAVVAFSINISMASLFSQKDNYKIDANQELLASGLGNMFGSLFSCLPFAASLSRSLIQHNVGGKTQLASIVSCALLMLVLLVIGPFFEPLPHCVLAGIILAALKGMLKQVQDLPSYWRNSHRDGLIWVVTFLSVILVDIDVGLGAGIIFSLGTIIVLSQKPHIYYLGNLPNTDIYLEMDSYNMAVPIPNVVIIRISGGLHFANKNYVMDKVKKLMIKKMGETNSENITKLVVDLSAVTSIDPASAKGLVNLEQDLKLLRISLCLANCSVHVYEQLHRCTFWEKYPQNQMFPSIHGALFSNIHVSRWQTNSKLSL